VARGLEAIDAACAAVPLLRGAFTDQVTDGVDSWTLRRPLGVCVGVTPASYPVMVPLMLAAPALVAGNAFVLRPAEEAPSPAMLLAELLHEAGMPGGVLNVVHGDRLTLDALLDHPAVQAVAFAGAADVARYVEERAAASGRRCRTLTGAKSHLVVLPDADLDAAADALAATAYVSDCQRCSSIATALAVGAAGDPFVSAVAARARALTVGPGADPATRMGPLTSARARDRVVDYVERAELAGAELVVDGRGAAAPGHAGGFFVGPCLFDRVSPAAAVRQDDTGGPVVLVVRVGGLDEALAVVRADPRAGGAALFTRDPAAARRFQREVVTAQVGINVPAAAEPAFEDPFAFYTRSRVVTARWDEPIGPNGGRTSEDRQMVHADRGS
jgi:malonate-semialdehyde dehydrogenase (acetylating)/methylmalonate-semialdehyde dehydrogenase